MFAEKKEKEIYIDENYNLEELYRKTYKMCLFWLRNTEEAEDVAQDVFLKVTGNIDKFREESDLYTWIWRICSNTLSSYSKRKKIISFLSLDILFEKGESCDTPLQSRDNPEKLLIDEEIDYNRQIRYEESLKKLTVREKKAFFLFYYEDLDYKSIANIMGTTEKAVESLLVKSRRKLKTDLEKI